VGEKKGEVYGKGERQFEREKKVKVDVENDETCCFPLLEPGEGGVISVLRKGIILTSNWGGCIGGFEGRF